VIHSLCFTLHHITAILFASLHITLYRITSHHIVSYHITGILGEGNLKQGECICPELDKACFTYKLGEVMGPLESSNGYHIVLVCERTGCAKLDGGNTRVTCGSDGYTTVLKP
jgi:hypothetical protein